MSCLLNELLWLYYISIYNGGTMELGDGLIDVVGLRGSVVGAACLGFVY